MTTFWAKREARTSRDGIYKRGYMYQGRNSRNLAGLATASAAFTTGETSTVVYVREITSSATSVTFRLFEVSGIEGLDPSEPGQNLNRTIGGSASASQGLVSASVTAASPTVMLATDVVGGAGGKSICEKVRTLAPETSYLIEWQNNTDTPTIVSATFVWSEGEPEPYDPLG